MGAHQRFLLTQQLRHLADLDTQIAALDAEVEARLAPFAVPRALLESHPGVGRRAAEIVLAEIGPTVEAFPSPAALRKGVGLAPGPHESAGKRLSGRTIPGNRPLLAALVEAAQAAGRTKATYLGAQYRRMARTKGAKRATVIVAYTIVVDLWYRLKRQHVYGDLDVDYFDRRDHERVTRQAVTRLESIGWQVTLNPAS
jgi:transposase